MKDTRSLCKNSSESYLLRKKGALALKKLEDLGKPRRIFEDVISDVKLEHEKSPVKKKRFVVTKKSQRIVDTNDLNLEPRIQCCIHPRKIRPHSANPRRNKRHGYDPETYVLSPFRLPVLEIDDRLKEIRDAKEAILLKREADIISKMERKEEKSRLYAEEQSRHLLQQFWVTIVNQENAMRCFYCRVYIFRVFVYFLLPKYAIIKIT